MSECGNRPTGPGLFACVFVAAGITFAGAALPGCEDNDPKERATGRRAEDNAAGDENAETDRQVYDIRVNKDAFAPMQYLQLTIRARNLAVRGKLVQQDPNDGTGKELLSSLKKARAEWEAAGRIRKEKGGQAVRLHDLRHF